MKIYMIRHGQTDWNIEGRFQGREDIPLNDMGMKQAKECGLALEKTGIAFDCIVSSPLIRAVVTAEEIAKCIHINEVKIEEDLTERDFGSVSGLFASEREARLQAGDVDDMEPWEAVEKRMIDVMERYAVKGYEHIIMVSHGASIRAVLSYLSEGQIQKLILKNTCMCVIGYKEEKFHLDLYNTTADEYLMNKTGINAKNNA